ncbi:MAG: hypothetical protein ACOC4H_00705, partial [bacterium]
VKIKTEAGRLRIKIKAHNSIIHAFFTVIVMSAVVLFLYYILPAAFLLFRQKFFMTAGNIVLAGFTGYAVFLLARSVLWTLGGVEIIEVNSGGFYYSKKIFNIGTAAVIPVDEIKEIKTVDFVREKEIPYMVSSELGLKGRAFLIDSDNMQFKFGIYLSSGEIAEIENILFTAVENAKGLMPGAFQRTEI